MIVCFLLCLAGQAAWALSLAKHHREILGASLPHGRQTGLRLLGWGLNAASLASAIEELGVGIGLVGWCGAATVGGLLVAMALTYRPHLMLSLGIGAPVLAMGLLCLSWSI